MEAIRENFRDFGKQHRQEQRENVLRHRRALLGTQELEEFISVEEVRKLAEKIKHKSNVDKNVLMKIKQALIQDEENINAFMNVDGSLSSLIREISGQNSTHQLEAVYCCCNLALGNPNVCYHLAKASVPYLILHLDSLNDQLLDACIWTVGNLAGCDVKSWAVLHTQGILTKLTELLSSTRPHQQSCLYALTHFIKSGLNNLSASELVMVATCTHVLLEREPTSCWLIFLLSCSPVCVPIFLELSVVCRTFKLLTQELNESESKKSVLKVTAYIRILGNLTGEMSETGTQQFLDVLYKEQTETSISVIQKLLNFNVPHVRKETIWFLNNVCTTSNISAVSDPVLLELQNSLRANFTIP